LIRPVLRGCCLYESLKDGTLDLSDVAYLNKAISVDDINRGRIIKALKES
jgi:hypothetical protein